MLKSFGIVILLWFCAITMAYTANYCCKKPLVETQADFGFGQRYEGYQPSWGKRYYPGYGFGNHFWYGRKNPGYYTYPDKFYPRGWQLKRW